MQSIDSTKTYSYGTNKETIQKKEYNECINIM